MAPGRQPPRPGLASLAASWHIWKVGLSPGQELLEQSKNVAVPEAAEEWGPSMFVQVHRELVAGPGAAHGLAHQRSPG